MKRPFRSRLVVDDHDDDEPVDDYDDIDLSSVAPPAHRAPAPAPRRPDDRNGDGEGDFETADLDADDDGLDDYGDYQIDADVDTGIDSEIDADELSSQLERLADSTADQRSAWAYLGLLTGLFGFLVLFGYACSDQRVSEVASTAPRELAVGQQAPSRIVVRVDDQIVTLQGSVPDEAAKAQLVTMAQDAYGAENVIDELAVDDATTLESGTIRFVGAATLGDERPEALHDAIGSDFGLANRGFEVGFAETVLTPVDAEVALDGGRAGLAGVLPDEQSVTDLVAIAEEVWGAGNVDSVGLSVGDATWTDGRIRVTGSVADSDQSVGAFSQAVTSRIDTLVAIDTTALAVTDNVELIAAVQATIDQLVTDSPIQFAPNSPVIEEVSDPVLDEVVAALAEIPTVTFEVVGHTDDVGPDDENLVLSQDRAAAVVERLTTLGIDPSRMTSRGEGEANPIADNSTDEGKAANRRIEFILVGTSG